MESLFWDCTFKDTISNNQQIINQSKRQRTLSTDKSFHFKHKKSLKKHLVNCKSLNKIILKENKSFNKENIISETFTPLPVSSYQQKRNIIIYRINSEVNINRKAHENNILNFKGRNRNIQFHNNNQSQKVTGKKFGSIAALKENMFNQMHYNIKNMSQHEIKKNVQGLGGIQRKNTLDDLLGKNSIKVSINPSQQSIQMSEVLATHHEMINQNGWLPFSLTTNASMVKSQMISK